MDGGARRGSKRSFGGAPPMESVEKKRRRATSTGYIPFQPIEIPSSWKKHPHTMQEVVWNAVSSCQYDDPEKKERLCTAVMDALSGEKTLKASSFFHGVPFTTVQTYFHRSREAMTKAMLTIDERDNEPPNQIQVPVPLTTASYDGHSSDSEQSNEKKCGKLDSVLGLLAAKMEQRANSEENSASPDCYAPTGSNKRKPKSVHRVVNEPIANDEEGTFADSLYDMVYFGSSDEPSLYGQPGVTVDGEMSDTTSDELDGSEDFAGDEYARKVAEGIVERSAVGKSTKVRLAKAIVKVWHGALSQNEACERYCLTTDYLEAYFGAFREVMQQSGSTSFIAWNGFADTGTTSNVTVSDGLSEANGSKGSKVSDGKKGCEKESYVVGPPLDPSDKKRIAAIDACIEDVCKPSLYSAEQKEKLHKAISMVVRGERTVNAAANIMQLPSSTLHPYVHKARVALGSLLPPQASGPTLWNSNKKIHEAAEQSSPATESNEETNQNTSINLEEIDEVLTGLLKNANCDESSKDKIYQATLMVLAENVSTIEAAKRCGIPANAVQPYVNKARSCFEQSVVAATHNKKSEAPLKDRSGVQQPTDVASDEEVRNVVEKLLSSCSARNTRREKLLSAVSSAVSGKLTIKDACQLEGLPASTVHPYVSKARHMLGARCPEPKVLNSPQGVTTHSSSTSLTVTQARFVVPVTDPDSDELQEAGSSNEVTALKVMNRTRLEMGSEIDKVLQQRGYKGVGRNLREALLGALFDHSDASKLCSQHHISPSTLNNYLKIIKKKVKSKKDDIKKEVDEDSPRKAEVMMLVVESESVERKAGEIREEKTAHKEIAQSSGRTIPHTRSHAAQRSSVGGLAKMDHEMGNGVLLCNVNAMALHDDAALACKQRRIKLLISFLIDRQYQRSAKDQEMLYKGLEHVLFDGLLVEEATENNEGLNGCVLRAYAKRCREINRCIMSEFPIFKEEVQEIAQKFPVAPPEKQHNSTTPIRNDKSASNRAAEEHSVTTEWLNKVLVGPAIAPMTSYIKKLGSVNFPVGTDLVIGLAEQTLSTIAGVHKVPQQLWKKWAQVYCNEHGYLLESDI